MKKLLLSISFILCGLIVSAQGIAFGHFQQSRKMTDRIRKQKTSLLTRAATVPQPVVHPLEEFQEVDWDENRRYRYVYAYNALKQRSSETIYMSEFVDGKWSTETLYNVGTYTYEMDTQGRIKKKTVKYDKEESPFYSYIVSVGYEDDKDITHYMKYRYIEDYNSYALEKEWSYRADGTVADIVFYELSYDSETRVTSELSFNPDGTKRKEYYGGERYEYEGTVNDFYKTRLENNPETSSGTIIKKKEHYAYDSRTGRPLLYEVSGEYWDTEKMVFEYDALGRIVSIKEYSGESNAINSPIEDSEITTESETTRSTAETEEEITWTLEFEEAYTYYNDEVYDITNPWWVILGIEGPVSTAVWKSYSDMDEEASITTFVRDENGKITSCTDSSGNMITIDENGQVTNVKSEYEESWTGGYDEEGNWDETIPNYYYNLEETSYVWENGKVVRSEHHEKWINKESNWEYEDENRYTRSYTYDENSVTGRVSQGNVEDASMEFCKIMKDGSKYVVKNWYDDPSTEEGTEDFDWDYDRFIVQEMQTEDISFIRPNIHKDMEGFSIDTVVVVSKAGRMICAAEDWYESNFYNSELDGIYHYVNMTHQNYLSVSHDGDNIVCSNIKGLPIYVLQGDRLLKEYKYYDMSSSAGAAGSSSVGSETTRAVTIPVGQIYDEISYIYNEDGLLTGIKILSVDSDGTVEGEVKLEYKYDATGIASTEIAASAQVTLNGRTLGINKEGVRFSLYETDGKCLASDVSDYTVSKSGIYVVVVNGKSIKLTVK